MSDGIISEGSNPKYGLCNPTLITPEYPHFKSINSRMKPLQYMNP